MDGEAAEPVLVTWYVEVGIVGDIEDGLSALETPSIVAPPLPASDEWLPDRGSADTPDPGDPLVGAVEDFLRAFLTGRGDPARYVAPGLDVVVLDPAPFSDIYVVEMAVTRHDDGTATVWTEVELKTEAGVRQIVVYDIALAQREGRWEVTEMPGVATRVGSDGDDGSTRHHHHPRRVRRPPPSPLPRRRSRRFPHRARTVRSSPTTGPENVTEKPCNRRGSASRTPHHRSLRPIRSALRQSPRKVPR